MLYLCNLIRRKLNGFIVLLGNTDEHLSRFILLLR